MLTTIIKFLEKSIELFKKNYNLFISLSVISGALSFFYEAFQYYTTNQDDTTYQIVLILLSILFFIFGLVYYGSRVSISLFLLIDDKINSRDTSTSKVFEESKSLFWNYLGNMVKLIMLIIIPVVLFIVAINLNINVLLKAVFIVMAVISILYIVLNYGLSINVSILQPEETSYFDKSKALFETNRMMVFLLFLFVIGISVLSTYIPSLLLGEDRIFNVIDTRLLLSTVLGVIISPISSGLLIYTYWHLNKEQEVNKLSAETI
ncbi:hypothetical protein [Ancylomarina sp. 16SWW S1-10-2]|uniref:hypothetical protein n=1 Tax=Ancylomarina sp. 16SWW S1-10-2 TaxID=2499681 RepID=UPI0012AE81D8|nr:hypothetical protein [Ancylomarina sp. 16SWW S1-10-2]MRT92655.1 hypothetical protein [Ancylomarina sp. 16SWW S1-10-2]